MHLFVTGGSGLTGAAVVAELIAAGHAVTGLARLDKSAARLRELNAEVLHGSLDDLDVLAKGARAADGVIHMAFGGDFSDPQGMARRDGAAISATWPSRGRVGQAVGKHVGHVGDGKRQGHHGARFARSPVAWQSSNSGRTNLSRLRRPRRSRHCAAIGSDRSRPGGPRLHSLSHRGRPPDRRFRVHWRGRQPLARRASPRCGHSLPAGRSAAALSFGAA